MSGLAELTQNYEQRAYEAGEVILEQGGRSGLMLVLIAGEVEVLRDEVRVAKSSELGAVFGEMSALLDEPHTATVRALVRSSFSVIEDPRAFLAGSAQASFLIAKLLAHRIDALNKYLIDVKRQYEDHDHIGMVDDVLHTLMHRHQRPTRT